MKAPFVLSVLFAVSAFSAKAQVNPVLVSDEITFSSFQANKHFTSSVARYAYGGMAIEGSYFPFIWSKCAIYVTESSGALYSIAVGVLNSSGYNGEIAVYGKNTAYTGYLNFYNGGEGSLIRNVKFSQSNTLQSITDIPQDYRYCGIAHVEGDSYISKITITWKLGYARENIAPGNLGTICLPYDVEKGQLLGVRIYSVVGKVVKDGAEAVVCDEVDHIEAGKPYLFTSESSSLFLLYSNPERYTSEQKGANGFYGNFTATTIGELRNGGNDDFYVVADNAIRKAADDVKIGANRAYFRKSELPDMSQELASSSRFILSENGFAPFDNGHATTISSPHETSASAVGFDLYGRRVSATDKGIVVRKGRVQVR